MFAAHSDESYCSSETDAVADRDVYWLEVVDSVALCTFGRVRSAHRCSPGLATFADKWQELTVLQPVGYAELSDLLFVQPIDQL